MGGQAWAGVDRKLGHGFPEGHGEVGLLNRYIPPKENGATVKNKGFLPPSQKHFPL